MQAPPLQTDQTANETDTQTDKGDDHEHQQQRIAGDRIDKGADPSDSFTHERSYSGQNSGNGSSFSRSKNLLSKYIATVDQAVSYD